MRRTGKPRVVGQGQPLGVDGQVQPLVAVGQGQPQGVDGQVQPWDWRRGS